MKARKYGLDRLTDDPREDGSLKVAESLASKKARARARDTDGKAPASETGAAPKPKVTTTKDAKTTGTRS
jgi:hypothetical protein